MTNEIQVIDIPIETTFKEIRSMKIPDKVAVEEFTKNAIKIVRMALVENDFYTAIDTMDKTRVIEDDVKAKVRRNHAQLVTQNIAAAGRYEILWELGGWLDENLVHDGRKTDQRIKRADQNGKPKFWLDDLGINNHQSINWQNIHANLTIDELRSWADQYLHDGASGKE